MQPTWLKLVVIFKQVSKVIWRTAASLHTHLCRIPIYNSKRHMFPLKNCPFANISSQSAPADHVLGYAHRSTHRCITLYHGCARSSASGRSHTRVLPPETLCSTTSTPWLMLSISGNCLNHTILVKFLTFVDFCVLAFLIGAL